MPIPEKVDGDPVYDLILFTRHPHGLWLFNDAASRAYFKHHKFTVSQGMRYIFDEHTEGKAGEKHVRAAVKRLDKQGILGGPPPVNVRLEDYVITPGPAVAAR